jgi:hypothetical protein
MGWGDINALSERTARKCKVRLQFSSNARNLNNLKLTPKDRNQTSMSSQTKKQGTGPNNSKANLLCMCHPSYCTTTSRIIFPTYLRDKPKWLCPDSAQLFLFLFFLFFFAAEVLKRAFDSTLP